MMTQNVLWRTFYINGSQYGSGFAIDVDGRQYLVTASHLLNLNGDQTQLKVHRDKGWQEVTAKVVGVRADADVAVLEMPQKLAPWDNLPLEASDDGLILGQDVYIIGFPLRWTDLGKGPKFPLIRKGTFSSVDEGDSPRKLLIDVINNAGFSGGLVVFRPGEQATARFQVAGVVTSFLTAHAPVLDSKGEFTGCTVETNTGLLIAHDIRYAVNLIHAHHEKCKTAEQP